MEKENKKTIEIPFGEKDSELHKFEYTIPEGYEAEIKDGKVLVTKKESENERIMKSLVEFFRKFNPKNMWDEVFSFGDVVSYLEKMKEHQNNSDAPNESSCDGTIFSSNNVRNLDELVREYIDGVKQYHPTPTWDLMQTAVCYGYHLREEVGSEDVESVKPVEWSEENKEPMEIRFAGKVYKVHGIRVFPGGKNGYIIEDEPGHYDCITNPDEVLGYGIKGCGSPYPTKEANFGQPHWKPSEEQMKAILDAMIPATGNTLVYLNSLYEQLKSL